MSGDEKEGRIVSLKHTFCGNIYIRSAGSIIFFSSPSGPGRETLQVAIFLPNLTRNTQVMSPASLTQHSGIHSAEVHEK